MPAGLRLVVLLVLTWLMLKWHGVLMERGLTAVPVRLVWVYLMSQMALLIALFWRSGLKATLIQLPLMNLPSRSVLIRRPMGNSSLTTIRRKALASATSGTSLAS